MAGIQKDKATGRYRVSFRFGGRQFRRSLKTSSKRESLSVSAQVEQTIRLIEYGAIELPPDVDTGAFVLSEVKLNGKPKVQRALKLSELFAACKDELPFGAKEEETLAAERRHMKHFCRHLKGSTNAQLLQDEAKESAKGTRTVLSENSIKESYTTEEVAKILGNRRDLAVMICRYLPR